MKGLLLQVTQPLGAIWLFMLAATVFWVVRRRWKCAVSMGLPVLLLWFAGTSLLPGALAAKMERPFARPAPAGPADVVLVLGGGIYASDHDVYGFGLGRGASRVVTGIELVRQGVATNLVLGGSIPIPGRQRTTVSKLHAWVESWNLPGIAVTNLGACSDTHEEVLAFKRLREGRGWTDVVLVTSAMHMRRAAAAFKKEGVRVVPAACDFRVVGLPHRRFVFVPSYGNLELLGFWIHEWLGWWVYKGRGWVEL